MYFVARNLYLALATFNFARGGVCGESLLSQESLLCAGKFSLPQEEVFTGSLYPAISHYLALTNFHFHFRRRRCLWGVSTQQLVITVLSADKFSLAKEEVLMGSLCPAISHYLVLTNFHLQRRRCSWGVSAQQ